MRALFIPFTFCLLIAFAGKKDKVLLKIDDHEVTSSEFKYIYDKNNRNAEDAYSKENLEDYMDLFIKFKLKVLEAERLGLDTTQAFKQELEKYRKQLAKPYLTEKGFLDTMVKEAYERLQYDVKASHILVKVGSEADPSDTLKAYNKIVDLKNKIDAGADFGDIAVKYSEDVSAQRPEGSLGHRGQLGYFSALRLVYPFESAAYDGEVGEVVGPVRTRFGYHLIKIEDKRPSLGKVEVAHIMVEAKNGIPKEDSIAAKRKADEIYATLIQDTTKWKELTAQFSDDDKTRNKGGRLFPFEMNGKLGVPEFEKVAFGLDEPGDISKPVKSPYGWHIIKLIRKMSLESFADMETELKKRVSKDSRAQLDKELLYARLKTENNFSENSSAVNQTLSNTDSTLLDGKWTKPASFENDVLFQLNDTKYTVSDFYDYALKHQKKKRAISPKYAMQLLYDDFVDESVYAYEEKNLSNKYYDYKMLVKEYRDGILLFNLMEDKVWNKAARDTVGLKEFYENHKDEFYWEERVDAKIYDMANKDSFEEIKADVESGMSDSDLKTKYNKMSSLNLNIKKDKFEKGENEIIDEVKWEKGQYIVQKNDRVYYVVVNEVLPKTPRTLDDSKGIIISEYQNHLEKEWIDELKKQYDIDVVKKQFKKLVKK